MNIIITGASSGLGAQTAKYLFEAGHNIVGISAKQNPTADVLISELVCDITDEYQISANIGKILGILKSVDILINNAGVNKISYLEDLSRETWDHVMDTNAKSIYLMSKALLPELIRSKGTILNIISNASHIPMTSSLAYNASKGAAYIMTKQLARELTKRHGITVFGISPNKLKNTGMSKYIEKRVCEIRGWTEEEAKQYQLNSLVTGEETDPKILAEFIAFLLSNKDRHKYLSGCVLEYGA